MKILSIIGARPQFVKAAAVSRAIRQSKAIKNSVIEETCIHTGQHYDENMSKIFFSELDIPIPKHNLGIHNLPHGAMIGQMLEKIENILRADSFDWVLVYGDTNSTLAGALAARKLNLKLCHIEAGVRSFNIKMPEEQNRILTDRMADILFCPSEIAVSNLQREGIPDIRYKQKVINVGDVMHDAINYYISIAENQSNILKSLRIQSGRYILSTLHRAENTDQHNRLASILSALKFISKDMDVVLPIHPRTKKILLNTKISTGNIRIVEPVSYLDMLVLEKNAQIIITDSGGIQKEAYFFNKPCITVRDETEWIELVNAGVNSVVGFDKTKIINAYYSLCDKKLDFSEPFYGNGKAGELIIETLLNN